MLQNIIKRSIIRIVDKERLILINFASIAQLVEHAAFNRRVRGSNPLRGIKDNCNHIIKLRTNTLCDRVKQLTRIMIIKN